MPAGEILRPTFGSGSDFARSSRVLALKIPLCKYIWIPTQNHALASAKVRKTPLFNYGCIALMKIFFLYGITGQFRQEPLFRRFRTTYWLMVWRSASIEVLKPASTVVWSGPSISSETSPS